MSNSDTNKATIELKRREMLRKLATMSVYTAPTVTILLSSPAQAHSTESGLVENYSTITSCVNDPTSMNTMGNMNHPNFGNPPNHCNSRHGPF